HFSRIQMARAFLRRPSESVRLKFREASYELLCDFLANLNQKNKDNLNRLSPCSGKFRDKRLMEYIFLMTKELRLDPIVGYHAVELFQRSYEESAFEKLKEKLPLAVFSCLQLSSKLHSRALQKIDNNTAVHFLRSVGHSVSKETVLESELLVLKGLEFRLTTPNPLTYVEVLLEVLGHNESSVPVEQLYPLCHHVLRFVSLQRTAVFNSLLVTTTQCASPSTEQRQKFVTVTEDYMLLGVGVIAVASFILYFKKCKEVKHPIAFNCINNRFYILNVKIADNIGSHVSMTGLINVSQRHSRDFVLMKALF
uniref:Cyclin N-terminal domain-containing protein n=1 Tax=Mola mola TaxID=94237 RepID=A0A3Q3XQJ4_MOLML